MAAVPINGRGSAVFTVTLVLIICATVFVILRLISKWGITRKATGDDYAIIIAWVLAVGLSGSIMVAAHFGLGLPDSQIHADWVEPLEKSTYTFTVLYNPALMATKTAILIMYHRMATAHPFLRYASLFVLAIVNIAGLVLTFLNIFRCSPVSAAYSEVPGKCIDIIAMYLSAAPINVLTDMAILVLPLPILTSLRIEFRQKAILVATFIVGGFITVVDVVRIVYLQTALMDARLLTGSGVITATDRPPNFAYNVSLSLMWSAVEVSVGIMCCCVLVLKPLVIRLVPSIFGHREVLQQNTQSPQPLLWSNSPKEMRSTPPVPSLDTSDPHSCDASEDSSLPSPTSPLTRHKSAFDSPPISPLSPPPPLPPLRAIPERDDDQVCDDDADLDFFQMLATEPPPSPSAPFSSLEPSGIRRTSRRATIFTLNPSSEKRPSEPIQAPTQTFLDFVQLKGKVPLTELSAREAWWPILFVSMLFFLWGFAFGIVNSLNAQIRTLLHYTAAQSIALQDIYWAAYLFGPVCIGYWMLKYQGFKATFMTGLAVASVGLMSFWPSSVLASYPGFLISNFIIALGLSVLENAANPFIALSGPSELSEARLLFSQGMQAVGTVVAPLLAEKALFSGIDEQDLFRVQWCYLAVALFVVILAIVFYYVPLSEAPDDALEAMAARRLLNAGLEERETTLGVSTRHLVLWTAFLAQMSYVGAQESTDYFWPQLSNGTKPGVDPFWTLIIGRALFTFGRFLASGLTYWGMTPRVILAINAFGAFTTSILAMLLPQGTAALCMLMLVQFFEAPLFPTIFAVGIRNQGRHTKFAATAITATIPAAGWWPTIAYAVDLSHGTNYRFALRITIALFGIIFLWPVLLSSTRVLRRWVDPKWSKRAPRQELESGVPRMVDHML